MLEAERTLEGAAIIPGDSSQAQGTALRLASVLLALGNVDEAQTQLATAARDPTSLSASDVVRLRDTEAKLAIRNGDFVAAEKSFGGAAAAAQSIGADASLAGARINALRARMDRKDLDGLESRLQSLDRQLRLLPSNEETAMLLLAFGDLCERAVQEFRSPLEQRALAQGAYSRARDAATAVATQAYAAGFLGRLYEDEGRFEEGLRLTFGAISLAQSIGADDQLYRWEWQAGRLERKLDRPADAVKSFDRALYTLAGIRNDVLKSSRQAFTSRIEPVYLDDADAHLRESESLADGSVEQQRALRWVRDQLESLKQAEVQDYFDNSCAVSGALDANSSTNVPGTAIIYPILLADRTDILIESGGVLHRFTTPVTRGEVTTAVRRLRIGLEHPGSGDQYRQPAQALYRWLLGEASGWLASQRVNTLVFVPSGALRTVPLSVLMDGNTFLIERYAIATTPAISLIPTLVKPSANRVLVAGLTKAVQGFPGLPGAGEEIRSIGAMFPSASLQDEKFSLATIRSDLSAPGFAVAHLATHGEFSADHRQSFILTYDSRLTMDGLQAALGRRGDPLDLLVLSACSTAAGDDRAALGLAGVAVQAGAKSALASLWSISDEATASLMSTFYRSRKEGGQTKAQSLRSAQLELLQSVDYRHPSYWAPYLLIGNWL
jgi:CHAT domain-containing protein